LCIGGVGFGGFMFLYQSYVSICVAPSEYTDKTINPKHSFQNQKMNNEKK
jgi:hypothetical protein